jgi:hypothetical protein
MIRPVTLADMDFCQSIAIKFCEIAGTNYDRSTVENTVEQLINNGIMIRSDRGIIGGLVFPLFMSGETVAQEFFWYSEGKDGKELLEAFEDAAKEKGATKIIMVSLHNEYQSKIDKIYTDLGYIESEKSFIKGI